MCLWTMQIQYIPITFEPRDVWRQVNGQWQCSAGYLGTAVADCEVDGASRRTVVVAIAGGDREDRRRVRCREDPRRKLLKRF